MRGRGGGRQSNVSKLGKAKRQLDRASQVRRGDMSGLTQEMPFAVAMDLLAVCSASGVQLQFGRGSQPKPGEKSWDTVGKFSPDPAGEARTFLFVKFEERPALLDKWQSMRQEADGVKAKEVQAGKREAESNPKSRRKAGQKAWKMAEKIVKKAFGDNLQGPMDAEKAQAAWCVLMGVGKGGAWIGEWAPSFIGKVMRTVSLIWKSSRR